MAEAHHDQSLNFQTPGSICRTIVQAGGLSLLPTYLADAGLAYSKVFIITDSKVVPLYGNALANILADAGIHSDTITIPSGEIHKSLAQAGKVIDTLAAANANRNDVVVALGGGVVGDLGGFVASIYNRGLPLVHIPTTLLAMVDSSIGGKTGVDHGGKNKTGSFYQPRIVLADPELLKTLNERTYIEGFGEIAKYAMLDADFISLLESSADTLTNPELPSLDNIAEIIARCVTQKAAIAQVDPHENAADGRILLNYGHTLAHALEAASNYSELLHGEAVAIGMNYAAQLAVQLGIAKQDLVDRQAALLQALHLPIRYTGQAKIDAVMKHMSRDKKNETADSIRFVLPISPGKMTVQEVDESTVHMTAKRFFEEREA